MGEQMIKLYREKAKKEWKIAFVSAVIVGFLVHGYKFTNYFPNHDGLFNFWSTQNMVASGRWLLALSCGLSSCFDLPWVIGILSVFFMALTAVLIAEIFEMKNPCLIVLSSSLLVSFPAVTETMFFEFTADGYMLAMLLATMAVYFSEIHRGITLKNGIFSAVCICFACAIYQAYVSFAFVLAVCYLMYELLENRYKTGAYWKWAFYQAGIFAAGLILYFGIWQLTMKLSGIAPSTYEGISSIGTMNAGVVFNAVERCVTDFVWFFLERNPLQYGVSLYSVLGILFGVSFVAACVTACLRSGILKQRSAGILFFLCALSLPFGCYLCYFTSPNVEYYTRMLQAIVVLYILLGVLCERWGKQLCKDLALLLLTAVILNHSVMANVCYANLNRCYEKSLAVATELSTRIHLEDDGTVDSVAFIGGIGGNWTLTEEEMMDASKLGTLGPLKTVNYALLSDRDLIVLVLNQYLDFTLEYYRVNDVQPPVYAFTQTAPVTGDFVMRFPIADQDTTRALEESDAVQQMGLWPAADSVRRIGSTIVVRFSAQ